MLLILYLDIKKNMILYHSHVQNVLFYISIDVKMQLFEICIISDLVYWV